MACRDENGWELCSNPGRRSAQHVHRGVNCSYSPEQAAAFQCGARGVPCHSRHMGGLPECHPAALQHHKHSALRW